MHVIRKIGIICCLVGLLTGCWDIKETENLFYVDAMGIDIEDGNYVIYAQYVDFSAVAKTDIPSKPAPSINYAKAYGRTIIDALYHLFNITPRRTSLEHIKSFILSEKVLQKGGIEQFIEFTARFFNWRRTMWIFVSDKPLDTILSVNTVQHIDPTLNILSDPMNQYQQYSNIKPLRLFQFEAKFYEPGETTIVPMIGLTNTWKEEDKKSLIQLKKEGVAFFANRKYVGKMHQHDLMGLKWLDKDFVRSTLAAMDNGEIVAKLLVKDAKVKITPVQRNGKIAFEVEGKYEGDIFQFYRDASLEEIKKYAEKELTREIMTTYQAGLKKGIDVYNLSHFLYRKHAQVWKKHQQNGKIPLDESSLIIKPNLVIHTGGQWKTKKED